MMDQSLKKIVHIFYFAIFSMLLALMSIPSWTELAGSVGFKSLNFLSIASQAFLEGSLLLLLGLWIKESLSKKIFYFYISLTFLLLLSHFINFIMQRLLDSSIVYVFKNLFSGGFKNFFVTLRAANINLFLLIILTLLFPLLPLLGIGFFLFIEKLEKKISYHFTLKNLVSCQLCFFSVLFASEILATKCYKPHVLLSFHKTLPWPCAHTQVKRLFPLHQLQLKRPRTEKKLLEALNSTHFEKVTKAPNIFLFVIESLRRDCIVENIAPNLFAFKKECLDFPFSLSNGVASQISWFSIFHANFPIHWHYFHHEYSLGSIPLVLLKKIGYEISVFSSAELGYHNMEEILFGKNHYITDTFKSFSGSHAWKRDADSMKALQEYPIGKKPGIFITFLDSTHSEYSYPDEDHAHFQPITPFINYVGLTFSQKDLPLIKNRYYNAIRYIDTLIGNFLTYLKEKNLYDDAIIIVLGDHGEEFFEEKALFHGTHLNSFQTHVPILCKFGKNKKILQPTVETVCQMDLFPSILHYIAGRHDFSNFFDGQSFFEKKSPWTIIAKQNAGLAPREIALTNGKEKILLEFSGTSDILESKELEIQPETNMPHIMEPLFEKELSLIFEHSKENPSTF